MLRHHRMNRVSLIGAHIHRTDFSQSNPIEAYFSRCSMSGADFIRAMIRVFIWIASNMTSANFNAKWDQITILSKGFDPNNVEFLNVGV